MNSKESQNHKRQAQIQAVVRSMLLPDVFYYMLGRLQISSGQLQSVSPPSVAGTSHYKISPKNSILQTLSLGLLDQKHQPYHQSSTHINCRQSKDTYHIFQDKIFSARIWSQSAWPIMLSLAKKSYTRPSYNNIL